MARRAQASPVESRPLARQRIGDRHHDTASEQLAVVLADDTQGEELLLDLATLGHRLEQRAVRIADLEGLEEIDVGEAAIREVLLGVSPLAEGLVVVLDDAGEERAGGYRHDVLPQRSSPRGSEASSSTPAHPASVRTASRSDR